LNAAGRGIFARAGAHGHGEFEVGRELVQLVDPANVDATRIFVNHKVIELDFKRETFKSETRTIVVSQASVTWGISLSCHANSSPNSFTTSLVALFKLKQHNSKVSLSPRRGTLWNTLISDFFDEQEGHQRHTLDMVESSSLRVSEPRLQFCSLGHPAALHQIIETDITLSLTGQGGDKKGPHLT